MTKRKRTTGQKERSTKHYTQSKTSSNTSPTKNRRQTQVLRKSTQFLLN